MSKREQEEADKSERGEKKKEGVKTWKLTYDVFYMVFLEF